MDKSDYTKLFQTIMAQNGLETWMYDVKKHTIILNESGLSNSIYTGLKEIPNIPEAHILDGYCHPEDAEALREFYRGVENGIQQITGDFRFWSPEKKNYCWKRCSYTIISDKDDETVYAIGSSIDVTDEVEAKERYRNAIELRDQTKIENLVLSGHCNISKNEIIEMNDLSGAHLIERFGDEREMFFHGLGTIIVDEKKREEFYQTFLAEPAMHNYELGITQSSLECSVCLDEEQTRFRWVQIQMNVVKVPETDDLEGFLTVVDVTKEKNQSNIIKTVANQDYDYIMVVDIETDTYELSAASDEPSMMATPTSGAYTQTIKDYADTYVIPEDRKIAYDEMQIAFYQEKLEHTDVYTSQARLRGIDGSLTYKVIKATYLNEDHRQLLITRIDITDIIKGEEEKQKQLSDALIKAELATQAKTDFLSQMSHDIRTPMNAILGLSALTLDEADNSTIVRENLRKITESGDYLLGLLNDILDMSKIESGSTELHFVPYAYMDFVENLKMMFEPLCEEKGIHFEFEEVVVKTIVNTDKVRLNQIFSNLLSNAIKYTPEGGTVSYYTDNIVLENGRIAADYYVSDTGIGMSPEFMERMFEPFTRENNAVTPELQGSGLGLSITKQLVELMGGTIEVQSEKNKGTTFKIHLSFEVLEEHDEGSHKDQAPKNKVWDLKGRRILLVEDHPINAQIAKKLLEKKEMIVFMAEDGKIGLDKFASTQENFFDAILMDVRMPNMNGIEATRAIRLLDRSDAKTVPIIAMTANAYDHDVEECIGAGMNDHLAKPVNAEKLYDAISNYITGKPLEVKPRIIVADDIETNAEVIKLAIDDEYDVIMVQSGREALQVLEENTGIVALITDIQMPEMNGMELIKEIRANKKYDNLAIIANTQYGDASQAEELLRIGADDFIYKPTSALITVARLKNVLSKYHL